MRTMRSNQNQMRPIALALATLFALTGSVAAQRPTPTDREDAILLLQGTSPTPRIDPEQIAEIERWLGKIRKKHPKVAEIHQMMGHVPGMANLILHPEAHEKLESAKWITAEDGRKVLQGDTGIPAFDKLNAELGVKIGLSGVKEWWGAFFDEEYDVFALCRRYEALAEVKHAFTNPWLEGDEIVLRRSGTKLFFVFKRGWGDCPSGCIYNHFYYFEVDTKAGTIVNRGELPPDEARAGKINLWGVPARFPTTPFEDFDAVLKAADHQDWWVALHGLEVTGRLLSGVDEPQYGEEGGVNQKQFYRVRDGLLENENAASGILLSGLQHKEPELRGRALWYLQKISQLEHAGDAGGIRAWKTWVADGAKARDRVESLREQHSKELREASMPVIAAHLKRLEKLKEEFVRRDRPKEAIAVEEEISRVKDRALHAELFDRLEGTWTFTTTGNRFHIGVDGAVNGGREGVRVAIIDPNRRIVRLSGHLFTLSKDELVLSGKGLKGGSKHAAKKRQ